MLLITEAITALDGRINELENTIDTLREERQEHFNKFFELDLNLAKEIELLGQSKDFAYDEFGDIKSWYRLVNPEDYSSCMAELGEYLSDKHYINLDIANNCIEIWLGNEEIVINHEGDVFQCDDVIITSKEYSSTTMRSQLIEDYMEKSGMFPSVFIQDYYGNLTLVNTQDKG